MFGGPGHPCTKKIKKLIPRKGTRTARTIKGKKIRQASQHHDGIGRIRVAKRGSKPSKPKSGGDHSVARSPTTVFSKLYRTYVHLGKNGRDAAR